MDSLRNSPMVFCASLITRGTARVNHTRHEYITHHFRLDILFIIWNNDVMELTQLFKNCRNNRDLKRLNRNSMSLILLQNKLA